MTDAEKDTKRLDWLSKETGGEGWLEWHWDDERDHHGVVLLQGGDGETLREAIDASMDAEKEKI